MAYQTECETCEGTGRVEYIKNYGCSGYYAAREARTGDPGPVYEERECEDCGGEGTIDQVCPQCGEEIDENNEICPVCSNSDVRCESCCTCSRCGFCDEKVPEDETFYRWTDDVGTKWECCSACLKSEFSTVPGVDGAWCEKNERPCSEVALCFDRECPNFREDDEE